MTINNIFYSNEICFLSNDVHLIVHLRKHKGDKPIHRCKRCRYCKKVYISRSLLAKHIRTPFYYLVGKESFADHSILNQHSRTYEKSFSCNVCRNSFTQKHDLQTHMLVHTNEMPHKCSYCEKLFRRKWSLKQHTMLHTGERPHVCKVCGEGFIWKIQLTRHMEKKHKN